MKQFAIDVDFRVTKRIYVDAKTAEEAEKMVKDRLTDNPYTDSMNPDSVADFDILEVSECEQEDDVDQTLKEAIDYVREQIDEDDLSIIHAQINKCYKQHLVPTFGLVDCDSVIALLEEYGEEHDLPEGWWEDYDDDEILLNI